MKRNLLLLTVLMLFALTGLNAANVSVTGAQTIAVNFFKVTFPQQAERNQISAVLKYTQTEPDGSVDFYVFNMSPQTGFVIVSAHDEVIPVLAYSNEGYFNTDFNKTGVINWINKTAGQIHNTVLQQIQADERINNKWASYRQGINPGAEKSGSLGPMCATSWSQEPYYNEFCPINPNDGQRCVTGCVATAMAQIMKYWNYPAQGAGSFSYDDNVASGYQNNIGVLSANFGATNYQWTQMPNYLTGNNTPIGILMSHCGISVAMDYSDGGSGAFVLQNEANQAYGYSGAPCAQHSYAGYFFYNPNTLQGVYQSNYTTTQWTNLLEAEMNAGRVVQYEGDDPAAGGHTWVCDGYDANNNLHMNWGWGGPYNGFYAVTNLSAGGYTFYYADAALIGIEPLHPTLDTGCTASAAFTYQNIGGSTIQFTNTSTSNNPFTSSWTFSNGQGVFNSSTSLSPQITFTGQPPYSAHLIIRDTFNHGCSDTVTQTISFNPNTVCATLQHGATKCSGAQLASYPPDASTNYSFASGYNECFAEQWTVNSIANEGRGLLQYDFSQIPVGSVIVSAGLSLYVDSLHGNGGGTYGTNDASYLYQVTTAWNPATVTWNTQPAITTTGGVLLPQSDSVNENYLNLDVTNFVQGWVANPATNYGMMLKMITQNTYNSLVFCSSAYADTSKWPKLQVCYIPPNSCQIQASFVQQNLGAGQVRFTNTSTDNRPFTSSWTFYNSTGQFATSTAANPVITFTGQPPFRATLLITDSVCTDTFSQVVNVSNCITLQTGNSKCVGAEIVSWENEVSTNYSFASGYSECFAEQWTANGTPLEGRGLLQYDLSQIPNGATILSANLSLYADSLADNGGGIGNPTYGSDNTCYLYQVTSSWNANTVTWNTQPAFSNNGAVVLAQSTVGVENYLNLDISNFVQGWVNNPGTNNGLMLKMVTPYRYNSMIFCSSSYADSTKWPRLDICYQVASPCHLVASFTQQNLGSGVVQFTNTSTNNGSTVIHWTFYNSIGAISTSTAANPLVTFTGLPPFTATLQVTDTVNGCTDSLNQAVNIAACLSLQQGTSGGIGAVISSYNVNQNNDFANGYDELFAEQWTVNSTPIETRALLQYDLSQIPGGSNLISADLNLYADVTNSNGRAGQPTYGTNNACNLYQVTNAWNPATVTWANQPGVSNTNIIPLAQSTSTNQNYLNINMTNFVQSWISNPASNNGVMLEIITQNYYNSLIFCSPSYADSTLRPLLQVCYFTPAPSQGCGVTDSFTYQVLGGDTVQFTNYSTSNQAYISSWTFSNANGEFASSSLTNPVVVFTGPAPYAAFLAVSDSGGSRSCVDSFARPINIATGINEPGNQATALAIFPNPNNGSSFNVMWPSGYDPQTTEIRVYDVLGREVAPSIVERHSEFCRLSISESASTGIYTVVVGNNSKQQCGKLVIVK